MAAADAPSRYRDPRADALRARYAACFGGEEMPVPVVSLAEDLLGLYVEERTALECSGMLLAPERRIVVNADEPEQRRRFTVAHELGHWVCQVLEGRGAPVMCRAEAIGQADDHEDPARAIEREANVFAAELLMPEPVVRAAWEELREIAATAARFGVSAPAMHWRLYNFGLVRERPAA